MATFELHLSSDSESPVLVKAEGKLPEYGQIRIWDMLYARVMHALGDAPAAAALRDQLELWAVNMSSKVFQPFDHIRSKGHLGLDPQRVLGAVARPARIFRVTVSGAAGEMPAVEPHADELSPSLREWLTLALAQHFINNNDLFVRELPIHILAFRKYYADVRGSDAPESIEEAPLFAIRKALEYFQSANRGMARSHP